MGADDLPDAKPENMVALTFLRLAPFTEPRGDETRHEMLSEMTSTVGSVFLGLTVGCAKCHDHKYDQIPTKDFYRLKAFFSTVQIARPEPGDLYQIGGPMPAPFYREGEAEWADQQRAKYREQLASSKKELESMQEEFHKRAGPVSAGFALQSTATGNNYLFDTTSCADGKLHYSIVNADGEWQFFTDGSSPNPEGSLSGKNQGNWFAHLTAPQHISLGEHARGTGMPGGGGHEGHFAELLLSPLNQQTRIRLPRRTRTTGCCHIFRSAGWMPSRYATVF